MPARFTAYPPDRAALVRVIDEATVYRLGRADDCELRIDHQSVSRYHAELSAPDSDWWVLQDTGSKNGLRVGGYLRNRADIQESSWFAVGDVYCWLEFIDSQAATQFAQQTVSRRATSRELSARFSNSIDIGTLIPQTLDVVLEMSGLERGFVLFAPAGEPLRVRASRGMRSTDISKASFSGSAAAVDQAIARRAPVVCCDTNESPWLGLRPSVRLGGIRALVCVPLRLADGATGVIYVDSRRPGPPVTELDLELIESVAQHAAHIVAVGHLQNEVSELTEQLDDVAPRWDALRSL
jgi:transcriptional regulator with GAF, ATPase, and Fis domain